MLFPLFPENWKSIPNFLSSKKTLKKCNLPDFKFYLSKYANKKKNPHMVLCYFEAFLIEKKQRHNLFGRATFNGLVR